MSPFWDQGEIDLTVLMIIMVGNWKYSPSHRSYVHKITDYIKTWKKNSQIASCGQNTVENVLVLLSKHIVLSAVIQRNEIYEAVFTYDGGLWSLESRCTASLGFESIIVALSINISPWKRRFIITVIKDETESKFVAFLFLSMLFSYVKFSLRQLYCT